MTIRSLVFLGVLVSSFGCGARTGLLDSNRDRDAAGDGASDGPGRERGIEARIPDAPITPEPCNGVKQQPCGTEVGECSKGVRYCQPDGLFGPCIGATGPRPEACNGLDDDCDGVIDNGFGLGQACDGPDSDLCLDDVMTCDGCSLGPDNLEVCNGKDDNCNGVIDSDCEVGDCSPKLVVTGSVPSSPACIDFPVIAGSTGTINYPCGGGPVTATLGGIPFSGSVTTDGKVSLSGVVELVGPDGCLWHIDHKIAGSVPAGTVTYSYAETLLTQPGFGCWSPCTETGIVKIDWSTP